MPINEPVDQLINISDIIKVFLMPDGGQKDQELISVSDDPYDFALCRF